MNTGNFLTRKGFFLSFLALGASALMSSCSNEDIQAAAGGAPGEDRVPIELQASIVGAEQFGTRTSSDINNSSFEGTPKNASVFVNEGANTSYDSGNAYTVAANGTMTTTGTPSYFPSNVNSVSVYGWYPATEAHTTSFAVQTDQNTNDNYVMSDLMYATPVSCTRSLKNGSWAVKAAQLNFQHVFSKLQVKVNPADGVVIKAVKLKGVATTVTIGKDDPSNPTFNTTSASDDVTLKSDATDTGTGSNSFSYYGVIPAQTISADANYHFLEVVARNAKGTDITVNFKFQTASALAQGKRYLLELSLANILTDATCTISNWNSNTGSATVEVGEFEDPAAMKSGDVMKYNPLYYVAQYNVRTINGVVDPATKTEEMPAGTNASETKFYTTHYGNENVFKFADLENLAKNGSATVNDAQGYHIPDVYEQNGVIPNESGYELQYNSDFNIFTFGNGPLSKTEGKMTIAGADVAAGTTSWWLKNGANDYYAVRFVNQQNYASAWHYKFISGSGLLIESYILATVPKDETSAKKILNALPYTNVWEGAKNEAPAATAPTTNAVVQRFLSACGYEGTSGQAGKATSDVGTRGLYWSATEGSNTSNGMYWNFNHGYLVEFSHDKRYGFSVRLFHD